MATKEEVIAQKQFATERYILSTLPRLYVPLYGLDGSTFISRDGYGHLCTVTGALWTPQGRTFDGSDDLIACGSAASIDNIFDGGGTVMAWINPDSDGEGDAGGIITKADAGGLLGWETRVTGEAAGAVKLGFYYTFTLGGTVYWLTTNTCVTIGTWSHFCLTYNADSTANKPVFYVNGEVIAFNSESSPTGVRTTDAAENLAIGNYETDVRSFDGVISEALAYDRVLSAVEIQHIYNSTKWRHS